MKGYDHKKIESKWQKEWEKKKIYQARNNSKQKKFYGLIEFPYPSGDGLHVGHPRPYIGMDIISRKRRMQGFNVLYPIGWDAFGLPTENYAIKTGISPAKVTKKNTDTFRRQIQSLAISFDWSREINTTDPAYYKWTQWIFLQFYKKGLAYKAKIAINWCPKDKIGLANEEVVNGCCERCGTPVEKREKEQWMLAITKYADRLDKDLDTVDYLEKIKIQQRNWIGKSEGAEIIFQLKANQLISQEAVTVFTTRADTLFGAFAVILAPEHPLVESLKFKVKSEKNKKEIEKYITEAKKKTDIERTAEEKVKTGVELKGIKAINPANGEEIPVWIADFVLVQYGTGAVFADMHDERDYAFAKKYNLPMKRVLEPKFVANGTNTNPPKEGLPFVKRNAVCVVLRNPKDSTYLCSVWKNFHMHGFITGGVEEGEDLIEAAKREVHEETGYKHVKLVRDPEIAIHSLFYHRVKKENRHARFQYLFFDLVDEAQDPIAPEEAAIHDIVWKTREELKTFFTVIEGEFVNKILDAEEYVYTGEGILTNSGKFNGMESAEAQEKIIEAVGGKIVTKYKLRDWVFSRQRYWGEPIPLVHCEKDGWVPVPEKDLPVKLPEVKSYQPTETGESPLAAISKWVNVKCPKCKGPARRETDTMPNWAGSSWYYLRYTDPKNKKEFASGKNLKYWLGNDSAVGGVDWYNGGMEHTTLHLLYSRFWHKFLYDLKLVPTSEPYQKRTSHGLILASGGEKMSKSKGNVVNPDAIVATYGADTLRIYEMFMGPFDQPVAWSTEAIIGPRRFLERVWRLSSKVESRKSKIENRELESSIHKTIKKVSEDIETMSFNTAISALMILLNEMEKAETITAPDFKMFLQLLAPFAPHIADELWSLLGEGRASIDGARHDFAKSSIHLSAWPEYDEKKIATEKRIIVIQVNGKMRGQIEVAADSGEEEIKKLALDNVGVASLLTNKEIKRVVYVPGKLINFVVV